MSRSGGENKRGGNNAYWGEEESLAPRQWRSEGEGSRSVVMRPEEKDEVEGKRR